MNFRKFLTMTSVTKMNHIQDQTKNWKFKFKTLISNIFAFKCRLENKLNEISESNPTAWGLT